MQQYEIQPTPARAALLEEERDRCDPRRRQLFWSAEVWDEQLTDCLREEQGRDDALAQALDSLPAGDPGERAAAQAQFDALEADVEWYRWLARELRATRERWGADPSATRPLVEELVQHARRVEHRLYERQVRLQQVTLELLERRRQAVGGLDAGVWLREWAALERALHEQELFYGQVSGDALPPTLRRARLRWYARLAAAQADTRRLWGHGGSDSARALMEDAALVTSEMARLEPALPSAAWPWPWIAGVGIVVAAGLALALLRPDAALPASPAAEHSGLVGAFAPPTGKGPAIADAESSERRTAIAGVTVDHEAAEQHNRDGLDQMVAGNCPAAIPLFAAAITADPSFYEPPNNLAFCLYEGGDVPGAIAQWRAALLLNPANPDAHAALGTALYRSGSPAAGAEQYRQALAINARYADAAWLRTTAFWSERMVADSAPLRR